MSAVGIDYTAKVGRTLTVLQQGLVLEFEGDSISGDDMASAITVYLAHQYKRPVANVVITSVNSIDLSDDDDEECLA